MRRNGANSCRQNIDGLTPMERAVCDLWDEGEGIVRISTRLGIPRKRASSIVSYLNAGDEDRMAREGMAKGSARLLAAMLAA